MNRCGDGRRLQATALVASHPDTKQGPPRTGLYIRGVKCHGVTAILRRPLEFARRETFSGGLPLSASA